MNWYKKAQNNEISVYHGSTEKLITFDPQKSKSGYYPGFYTTTNPSLSTTYGTFVHEYKLDPSKYFDIPNNKAANDIKTQAKKAGFNPNIGSGYGESEYLKSLGYQGIRIGIGTVFIVFNPQTSLKVIPNSPETK